MKRQQELTRRIQAQLQGVAMKVEKEREAQAAAAGAAALHQVSAALPA
jgi:hypothetical protein